jgi:prepilin-type N-terminal cleavage/methylation domain-containing protein
MKKEQGFSLIELLIVVAIIAIIAAIAVPSMLTARMAANESGAIQGCRTVGSAEVAFSAVNNQQFTALTTLVEQDYLDDRFTNATGFNGYGYDGENTATTFTWNAEPQTRDSTGRYDYKISQDLVVRYGAVAPDGNQEDDAIGAAGSGS